MENYIIKKKNKNKEIIKKISEKNGYVFKPNIKNNNLIKINTLTLQNNEMINGVLKRKLDKSFRKIAGVVLSILNSTDDDTTSGDILIALNEIAKEKSIIAHKYSDYLKKEERDKYLKRLKIMEQELKEKMVYLKMSLSMEEEREKGHSR